MASARRCAIRSSIAAHLTIASSASRALDRTRVTTYLELRVELKGAQWPVSPARDTNALNWSQTSCARVSSEVADLSVPFLLFALGNGVRLEDQPTCVAGQLVPVRADLRTRLADRLRSLETSSPHYQSVDGQSPILQAASPCAHLTSRPAWQPLSPPTQKGSHTMIPRASIVRQSREGYESRTLGANRAAL
jgi:hypothetical protein